MKSTYFRKSCPGPVPKLVRGEACRTSIIGPVRQVRAKTYEDSPYCALNVFFSIAFIGEEYFKMFRATLLVHKRGYLKYQKFYILAAHDLESEYRIRIYKKKIEDAGFFCYVMYK